MAEPPPKQGAFAFVAALVAASGRAQRASCCRGVFSEHRPAQRVGGEEARALPVRAAREDEAARQPLVARGDGAILPHLREPPEGVEAVPLAPWRRADVYARGEQVSPRVAEAPLHAVGGDVAGQAIEAVVLRRPLDCFRA